MTADLSRLVRTLHGSGPAYVLAATGGGAGAAAALLGVPGGARTVLEVVVPYGERALEQFLGGRPESACSAGTARRMAERALDRASWLAPGQTVAGVAVTASLATDRPKRGEHRVHAAVRTAGRRTTASLVLAKGARDRAGEEDVLDRVLLNLMAAAFGLADRVDVPLRDGESVQTDDGLAEGHLAAFFRGERPAVCVQADGRVTSAGQPAALVLPGAFNPVHEGHWGLAEAAARLSGLPPAFEISIANVDKPPLEPAEVRRRLAAFAWKAPVWLTRTPRFYEKAAHFPGAVFAVGADTAVRVVAPRYYGDSLERRDAALEELRRRGCRFLVAGRVDAAGRFTELADLDVPEAQRDLFQPIPARLFRADISSTELRRTAGP